VHTTRTEAGRLIGQAADLLHATLYPGDELRGRRNEIPSNIADEMDDVLRLLRDAEDLLDPGIGQPSTADGVAKLQEAKSKLGGTGIVFMPTDVTQAHGHAKNLITRAEHAARVSV
jgi:hypothetical protein